MRGPRFWFSVILFYGITVAGYGQSFPFQLFLQQGETLSGVANGSSVGIGADDVGQPVTTKLIIIYRGSGTAHFTQAPQLLGSPAFTIVSLPSLPVNMSPGDILTFDLLFSPTSSRSVNAAFNFAYNESVTVSGTPPTTQTINGVVSLGLTGGTPDIGVSYFVPTDNNVIPLSTGDILTFPKTPVGTTSTVTISIANRGTATGKINAILVSGAPFQPLGLPFLPTSIDAGKELRFNIQYAPKQIEIVPGDMRITLATRSIYITLNATSAGPQLVYTVLRNGTTSPVSPNDSIPIGDTPIGETSTLTLQVRNAGNGDATISTVVVTGTGYQLSDAPPTPRVLSTDGTMTVSVAFSPTQPGVAHGRVQIGTDFFDLAATGIGARFNYSYTAGTAAVPVLANGSVFFSPTQAGQTAQTSFTIQNTGTSPATISSIGIQESRTPFTLTGLPALPVTLNTNQSLKFTVTFTPLTVGFSNATLRIDNQSFSLTGSGTAPPTLPDFRLTGPNGTISALGQPSVSLTLAASYPLTLSGTLSITIDSQGLADDPAVQFATGGKSVAFTIPANTTRAIFANSSPQVGVQTGSVAGSIVITPSFSIPGGADLTPSPVSTLQFNVAPSPPALFGIQVASQTPTQLVLSITGLTTTRSLTQLDFEFTPASGVSISPSKVSINIASGATVWFNSPASQAFGGQFVIAMSFNFRSDQSTPVNDIQSVSVTATNDRGTSNALSLTLH